MNQHPSKGIKPQNLDIISGRISSLSNAQAKVDLTRLVDEVNRLRSLTIAAGWCPDCSNRLTDHQDTKYCDQCNSYMDRA